MSNILLHKETTLIVAIIGISLMFATILPAYAQYDKDIILYKPSSGDWPNSLAIFCWDEEGIATNPVHLKLDKSVTIGCETDLPADIHLKWGPTGKDVQRVVYCAGATWTDPAKNTAMNKNDVYQISCWD